jgi:hypothetical protein
MAEDHIHVHQVQDRWGDDANWATIQNEYFGFIPPLLRGIVTRKLRRTTLDMLHKIELGRMTVAERLARVEPDLIAITARLDGRLFLSGATPSAANASVGAILGGNIAAPVPTPLLLRV